MTDDRRRISARQIDQLEIRLDRIERKLDAALSLVDVQTVHYDPQRGWFMPGTGWMSLHTEHANTDELTDAAIESALADARAALHRPREDA